ncbi:unnamed protein product [Caenorhabditis angaria]|uniref:THAP-type domain-containing protein n=1 Tax=Caenorhabditis angaria TaxID=860376 RepID=A0A9P1IFQ9_9PELO|nr:unnamed protein product [Caenorhabditis angaria]
MSERVTRTRNASVARKRYGDEFEQVPLKRPYNKSEPSTIKVKVPPSSSSTKKDTPKFVKNLSQKSGAKEFTTSSEDSEIDVTGDCVLPKITASGEEIVCKNERTPTKNEDFGQEDDEDEEEEQQDGGHMDTEMVFSSFPCHVIPDTLVRLTKTPVDGEHLEVRKMANGRLRILVAGMKTYTPYSTMTHRPCIVCNRQMTCGEMHLNFPADLDRRRIWANLLGFKYKDILRSKIGPVTLSVAGGPICTEHFSEECFRNHNFNKAAIEAFGVPVAISPDVKTTPSKKRVPWVCTICPFNTCDVTELRDHLVEHTDEMMKDQLNSLHAPPAGFMCPFCRKCTYGYRTVSGFRRHLLTPPVQHCHLRRIYEFAKMNCRASELEPIDSWEKWTRRNVYVAYHGCEPPVDEIVLTPSPTKKSGGKQRFDPKRQAGQSTSGAVRSLSFGNEPTSAGGASALQRKSHLLPNNPPKNEPIQEELDEKPLLIPPPPISTDGSQTSTSTSSPTKKPQNEPKKEPKVDDVAFAQMIEKRAKNLQRLMNAKKPTTQQAVKPRKPNFTLKMGAAAGTSEIKPKIEGIVKEEVVLEDERPLKSVLARSFAAGEKPSMEKYKLTPQIMAEEMKKQQQYAMPPQPQPKIVKKSEIIVRRFGGGGGVLGGKRPMILSSPRTKIVPKPEAAREKSITPPTQQLAQTPKNEPVPEPTTQPEPEIQAEPEKSTAAPPMMTLADALAKQGESEEDPNLDANLEELLKDPSYSTLEFQQNAQAQQKNSYKMKQEMRMSKQCIRQLEAARARARLFGEGNEQEETFDIVNTEEGPQVIARNDPEWKIRNQNLEGAEAEPKNDEI